MMLVVGLVIGLMLGVAAGMFVMALLVAGRDADEEGGRLLEASE